MNADSPVKPEALDLAALRRNTGIQIELRNRSKRGLVTVMSVTRHMLVSDLKKKYLEVVFGKTVIEWFDLNMSKDDEELNNDFTLMKYNLRNGTALTVWIVPIIHVRICPKLGKNRAIDIDVTDDWEILKIKEEFARRKYEIQPHDWAATDVTLMMRKIVLEDSRKLGSYGHGKRVILFALFNWKGHTYLDSGTDYGTREVEVDPAIAAMEWGDVDVDSGTLENSYIEEDVRRLSIMPPPDANAEADE